MSDETTQFFNDDWRDFMHDYSFKDKHEVYTNGDMLMQVYRVEQMIEHYFERR